MQGRYRDNLNPESYNYIFHINEFFNSISDLDKDKFYYPVSNHALVNHPYLPLRNHVTTSMTAKRNLSRNVFFQDWKNGAIAFESSSFHRLATMFNRIDAR